MSDAELIAELLAWAEPYKHWVDPELRRLLLIAADRINYPTPRASATHATIKALTEIDPQVQVLIDVLALNPDLDRRLRALISER